jgi:hypothetical protein
MAMPTDATVDSHEGMVIDAIRGQVNYLSITVSSNIPSLVLVPLVVRSLDSWRYGLKGSSSSVFTVSFVWNSLPKNCLQSRRLDLLV